MYRNGYTIQEIRKMVGGIWPQHSFDWYPSGWYNTNKEIRVRFVGGSSELVCTREEFERGKFNRD